MEVLWLTADVISSLWVSSKQKLHRTKVNRKGRLLQSWRKGKTQFELYFLQGGVARGWILGYLCLLIDFTQRKIKLSPLFITGGNFPTCSEGPIKVSFCSPIWNWEIGALLPLMFSVQRWLPGTWRKVLDCKTGKRPVLEHLHLKGTEKGFIITSVLK